MVKSVVARRVTFVFMWRWQKELVRQQETIHEVFDWLVSERLIETDVSSSNANTYIDDVLLMWNKCVEKFKNLLNIANTRDRSIKLDY